MCSFRLPTYGNVSLTLIGMSSENKKIADFLRHLGALLLRLNELGRVSNNLIDVNSYLQKSLEIFDKNSADKI